MKNPSDLLADIVRKREYIAHKRLLAALGLMLIVAAYAAWGVLPNSDAQSYEPVRKAFNAIAWRDSAQGDQLRVNHLIVEETAVGLPAGVDVGGAETITGTWTFNRGTNAPFILGNSNAGKVANFNADELDGLSESAFFRLSQNETVTGDITFSGEAEFNDGLQAPKYATKPTCNASREAWIVFDTTDDRLHRCNGVAWAVLDFTSNDAITVDLSSYTQKNATESITATWNFTDGVEFDGNARFNAAGALVPHTVSSTSLFGNLNAARLGGQSESAFFRLSQSETVTGNTTFNRGSGNAPFTISGSTNKVTNLDADELDGLSESAFFRLSQSETVTGNTTFNRGSGNAPFTISGSTNKVTNLDADELDGLSESAFFRLSQSETVTGTPEFQGGFIPDKASSNPATCNSANQGRKYFNTSDQGDRQCNNADGSYDWDLISQDADGDGFSRFIDADDADDAVYTRNLTAAVVQAGTEIGPSGDVILTGTLRYETLPSYSGSDVQITRSGTNYRLQAHTDDVAKCQAFVRCRDLGNLTLVSFTTATHTAQRGYYSSCGNTSFSGFIDVAVDEIYTTSAPSSTGTTLFIETLNCQGIGV